MGPLPVGLEHTPVTLDDFLMAADTLEACKAATTGLLRTLGGLGYRVSVKVAQLGQTEETYLGYILKRGQKMAVKNKERGHPRPSNCREVRELLRSAGLCSSGSLGLLNSFSFYMRPWWGMIPLNWTSLMEKALNEIKAAILNAPALALPDATKPSHMYVDEKKGKAKGVLLQTLEPWKRPVAYLSKKLDPGATGWPPCLCIIAASALLGKDPDKLTLGQTLIVSTPCYREGP